MARFVDYYPPDGDHRSIAYAYQSDTGVCPDGCNTEIAVGDVIAHDDDLGAWVHADHGDQG